MELFEVYNSKDCLLEKDEMHFIKQFYKKRFYKKHFKISKNDCDFLLRILLKNDIKINDLTKDLQIHEEVIDYGNYNEYILDDTTIEDYEDKSLLKNIYLCDMFRNDNRIPCFDLYFKIFISTVKKSGNLFIQYQIKHFQFK